MVRGQLRKRSFFCKSRALSGESRILNSAVNAALKRCATQNLGHQQSTTTPDFYRKLFRSCPYVIKNVLGRGVGRLGKQIF
jgi:hypothetical protein